MKNSMGSFCCLEVSGMPARKKSKKISKIVSFFWPPCCGRGVRRENLTCSLTNEYPFAKTSIPVLCGSTSQSSWCAMIRFAESDRTSCKCRVAPDMAMTTGMTMVLPSSHSPAMQDHAMGAALSERQGGETPVRQNSYLPLSDFRESVIDSSAPGVEDK